MIFLFLSASALLVGQIFFLFSLFCLPLHCWSGRHFPVFPVFVCLCIAGRADIFLLFLFLSAFALLLRQTFFLFSLFCLPLHHWSGRHFSDFPVFVCLCIVDRADIFLVFFVLSASALLVGQTFSCFSCFCLPLLCCSGRHFSCFPCFVCLCITGRADFFLIFLFLSADS